MTGKLKSTTVGLTPSLRALLDGTARQAGVSRSEMLRRALTSAFVGAPLPASYVTDSDHSEHTLVYSLPNVTDSASAAEKERVAVRNSATLVGRGQVCEAEVVIRDELSARANALTPREFVPSRSVPFTGVAVATRVVKAPPSCMTVHAAIEHTPDCPAMAKGAAT